MARTKATPANTPTNIRELLRMVRFGDEAPEVYVARFAQYLKAREDAAWTKRADWGTKGTPASSSEASVCYGQADAYCDVLGDQPLLSQDIRSLGIEGLDGL